MLQTQEILIKYFIIIGLWETLWKGFALWKAAKNQQKGWYLALLLLNTIGILPITYLILNRKKA